MIQEVKVQKKLEKKKMLLRVNLSSFSFFQSSVYKHNQDSLVQNFV